MARSAPCMEPAYKRLRVRCLSYSMAPYKARRELAGARVIRKQQ